MTIPVEHITTTLTPDASRVLFRPFYPNNEEQALRILARVLSLSDREVEELLSKVVSAFDGRHRRLREILRARYQEVRQRLRTALVLNEDRQLLIGAYFAHEYAFESTALFNPSIVWHPDQSGVSAGDKRFIISLRATGEGHISSITFRSGVVNLNGDVTLDASSGLARMPDAFATTRYSKQIAERTLREFGLYNAFVEQVLGLLRDKFTNREFEDAISRVERAQGYTVLRNRISGSTNETARSLRVLAMSNYQISFSEEDSLSERVIFPSAPIESKGIEDARFVHFTNDDGSTRYYATYTAYDGDTTMPQLLETQDFQTFRMTSLLGPSVVNKGLALFPRKVGGAYMMLSRQDNESIYLMQSEHVRYWETKQLILQPVYPWEFVQMGNCGSPIETEEGWLVISHGVGAMRQYSVGAFLLDRDDPYRVIGRLSEPLLTPDSDEREGYVPNVVYSCGAVVHGENLVIPFAQNDYSTTFARMKLSDLLERLRKDGAKV